jgi:hypothetical protein
MMAWQGIRFGDTEQLNVTSPIVLPISRPAVTEFAAG